MCTNKQMIRNSLEFATQDCQVKTEISLDLLLHFLYGKMNLKFVMVYIHLFDLS